MSSRFYLISPLVALAICAIGSPASYADATKWSQYTKDGSEAFHLAQYGKAEKLFKLALKEAIPFGDHDARLAASLTNLGVLYKAHGQETRAEPIFERAVQIQTNALGANNIEVISSIAKLCQFYISRNEWTKANNLCSRVTTYAEGATHDRSQMTNAFKNVSAYYQKHHELEDAEVMVKQAQELTVRQSADHDLDFAVLLDGLAKAYEDKPQAEPLFKVALEIRETSLGANHMAVASSCENLAKLYMDTGRNVEAEPLFRQAFEISEKTMGDHKPETITRADSLAQCLIKLNHNQEAETLYRRALENCEEAFGKNSGYTAKIQIALSSLLTKQGRYSEAAPLLAKALKTSESMSGPQNASLVPILEAYADVLDKTNHKSEANKLKNRAKSIRM
ncbi:MAG TPA: tetratricopeptide repeat protein [Trichormus sp.]